MPTKKYYKYQKVDRAKYVTVNQLAGEIGIWQGTFAQLMRAGRIPKPEHNHGGSINYYTRAEADKLTTKIKEWLSWKTNNPLKAKR